MVTDSEIWSIAMAEKSLKNAVSRLIAKARENGGEDNITAVLIGFSSDEDG